MEWGKDGVSHDWKKKSRKKIGREYMDMKYQPSDVQGEGKSTFMWIIALLGSSQQRL